MRSLVLVSVLTIFQQSLGQFPDNPCPNIFQYKFNDGVYYGEIRIPNDGSKELNIAVNISMSGLYADTKLKLDLLTPTDKILTSSVILYRLNFPFQNILPKITQITFNNEIYCKGAAEKLTPNGVTSLWSNLQTKLNQYTYTFQNNLNDFNSQLQQNQNNLLNILQNNLQNTQFQNPTQSQNVFLNHLLKNQFQNLTQQPQVYPTTPSTTKTPPPSRISNEETCGVANNIQTLVVQGEETRKNEFPWLAAMFHRNGASYQFRCTANLISAQHVVTAGHCLRLYKSPLVAKEDILLVFGRSDISHWATGALIRTAMEVIPHPEYTQNSGHCDIAIIKINEEITFKPTAHPICLWDTDENLKNVIGIQGVVAGWGQTETADSVTKTRKASLPIVAQDDCLRSHANFQNMTSDKTFCAGNRDGKGPCSGDSGAAFMIKRNNRWFLRGLVSTAIKNQNFSCDLNEYVVFVDIAKLRDWILKVIG